MACQLPVESLIPGVSAGLCCPMGAGGEVQGERGGAGAGAPQGRGFARSRCCHVELGLLGAAPGGLRSP